MNRGKFASLIMLSAFLAGVVSSSAVSAQGDENLASVVDNKSASSHDDSVSIDPKVSNEPVVAADETNIYIETTTDEETQDDRTDDNSDERTKKILIKKDNEDRNYLFTDGIKRGKENKEKKIKIAKGMAVAAGGASAIGGVAFGISELVKSSGKSDDNGQNTEPIDNQDNSDGGQKKGGFRIGARG